MISDNGLLHDFGSSQEFIDTFLKHTSEHVVLFI